MNLYAAEDAMTRAWHELHCAPCEHDDRDQVRDLARARFMLRCLFDDGWVLVPVTKRNTWYMP